MDNLVLTKYRLNRVIADMQQAFGGRCASGLDGWASGGDRKCRNRLRREFLESHPLVERVLGHGHFSIAVVLKDSHYCTKFSLRETDAWVPFAMYCRQTGATKHMPTILHLQRFSNAVAGIMPIYKEIPEDDAELIVERVQDYIHGLCVIPTMRTDDSLQMVVADLFNYFSDMAQLDIHGANIMYDDDGEVVIVDPVSFTTVD